MDQESIIREIVEKYKQQGENPELYLNGFLRSKPLTYWDYVQVETLLSLQQPKTDYIDEENFIIYSQVTELLLKSVIHELGQITGENSPTPEVLTTKVSRINKYTTLLISFFDMMTEGVDYEQYSKFRLALAPASGFQSVQFRYVELRSTRIQNLLNKEGKKNLSSNYDIESIFDNLYWKDAGINRTTGKKTLTLRQFEEKYQNELIAFAKKIEGNTLEDKVMALPQRSEELTRVLKELDLLYNVRWPMVHIKTASHFLEEKGKTKKGTGGTEWKNYLHPRLQQRIFFPMLWTPEELNHWGEEKERGENG